MMDKDAVRIRALEERGLNAWPALQTMLVDGWVLRFADGYTKRANSACPLGPDAAPAGAVAGAVEAAYARHGLPAIFRLTPLAPPGTEDWLESRGYRAFEECLVMTAPLSPAAAAGGGVTILPAPDAAWLDGFAAGNRYGPSVRPALERLLAAIRPQPGFATLAEAGEARAWGLAVAERGLVGLFDILVEAPHRRRGLGRRLVAALMEWGREQGAGEAYLQVVGTNAAAIALYGKLGFTGAYCYVYYRK